MLIFLATARLAGRLRNRGLNPGLILESSLRIGMNIILQIGRAPFSGMFNSFGTIAIDEGRVYIRWRRGAVEKLPIKGRMAQHAFPEWQLDLMEDKLCVD